MRRHALEQGSCCLFWSHARRHLDELCGCDQCILGVTAEHGDRRNKISRSETSDARAELFNRAGSLATRSHGQRGFVLAAAEIYLNEIDTDGFDTDEDLSRAGLRNGQINLLKDLGSAYGANLNGFHITERVLQGSGVRGQGIETNDSGICNVSSGSSK